MVSLGEGGRLVIPARLRRALEIEPGDALVLTLAEGELRVTTRRQAIVRAQATVRRYTPDAGSLVDELIEERGSEAAEAARATAATD